MPARVPRRFVARSLPVLALAAPVAAHAQTTPTAPGTDADLDIVRPVYAPEILPGIDVPSNWRGGSVRAGLSLQYTNSPLVLYEFEREVGDVIQHRFTAFAGVSVDISRAFTARVSLPLYYQTGSTVPRYAADGISLGDVAVGGHWAFLRKPVFSMGLSVDLTLPTSRSLFYAGERIPKLLPMLLFGIDVGRVRIASNLGANVRFRTLDTQDDLRLGTELVWNTGVRVNVIKERLDVGATIYSRFGFSNFFGAGESTGEVLGTIAYTATPWLVVELSGGRGFTQGYGSSDLRVFGQLRFQRRRLEVGEDMDEGFVEEDPNAGQGGLQFNVRELTGLRTDGEGDLPEPDPWEEGVLAKQQGDRIDIRYAIQFKVGTAELLPESYPTLDFIADLMNGDARIGHLVIEGHASPEGTFENNYDLSIKRAASIWKRLVEQRVHPSRLSYRGMGEVVPIDATGGIDELKESRRVVFKISRQYEEWETPPQYELDQVYPWNGETYEAQQPRMPTAEERMGLDELLPSTKRPERSEDTLKDVSFDDEEDDDGGEEVTPPADDTPDETPPPADAPAPDAEEAQ
ncbi:MAG: OmpA family protein [Alphaproteobacteria bacterium]|nr:OmpA family protein [Alphaproteobacteria bacterium]